MAETDPNPETLQDAATAAIEPAPVEDGPAPAVDPAEELEALRAARQEAQALLDAKTEESAALARDLEALRTELQDTQGLLEAKTHEATDYHARYEQTVIKNGLLAVCGQAVNPEAVLKLLEGHRTITEDGRVLVDGKPAKEAVAEFLKENPYLAKAGPAGSGAPVYASRCVSPSNPWGPGNFNMTEQARLLRNHPDEAARLKREAGF